MFVNCVIILDLIAIVQSAKILVVAPTPAVSHQVVSRALTQELIRRDHEVIVITTDPIYPEDESPNNLIEINLHDLSYMLWLKMLRELAKNKHNDTINIRIAYHWLSEIFIEQLKDESLGFFKNTTFTFDLLILPSTVPATLILSHIFRAPAIFVSPFGALPGTMKISGSVTHPLLYPTHYHKNIYNLNIWDKIYELYMDTVYNNIHEELEIDDDRKLKSLFGIDVPTLNNLKDNVHMLFLNVHPIWLHSQAVPANVVYTRGVHKTSEKMLPEELQSYLDSSKYGVIYMSFGSIFKTSQIASETLDVFVKVFSQLPYNILWKWDMDELPGKSENIKISKWLPQYDVLRHPNLKLFITHGGLQSTNEAINAAVPLIGIPQFSDQDYNTEKYVHFKIGVKLDYKSLTVEKFENAIETVLANYKSYKKNIIQLRTQIYDQPKPVLEHVIWRIEYLLRHGGVQHLRAPAANMSWVEYYELEVVLLIITGLIVIGTVLLITVYICLLIMLRLINCKINVIPMKRE